jgi:hypothetical protein
VKSSRAIERLCRRDAGHRSILCEHVPDHAVMARLRRRHVDRLQAVFAMVLRMCRDAGLIRLGLVVLDGTKVKAHASLEANRSAATIEEQVRRMLAEAESMDQGEDRLARLCACADVQRAVGASAHAAQAEDEAGPDHLRPARRVGGAGHWPDEGPPGRRTVLDARPRRMPGRVACASRRAQAAQAAPGVCPAQGGSPSDGRKAGNRA